MQGAIQVLCFFYPATNYPMCGPTLRSQHISGQSSTRRARSFEIITQNTNSRVVFFKNNCYHTHQPVQYYLTGHASYHEPTICSVTGIFLSLDLVCGTVYLQIYDLRCNSGHSGDNSKQYCLVDRDHGAL